MKLLGSCSVFFLCDRSDHIPVKSFNLSNSLAGQGEHKSEKQTRGQFYLWGSCWDPHRRENLLRSAVHSMSYMYSRTTTLENLAVTILVAINDRLRLSYGSASYILKYTDQRLLHSNNSCVISTLHTWSRSWWYICNILRSFNVRPCAEER